MALLMNYREFIHRVNELGYMPFAPILPGMPSLSGETPPEQWHTGDPETDPWQWKDRAVEEKQLAFGCVLGGNKGFISGRLYPYFHAAFHPDEEMEERRDAGLVSQTVWQLWQIFQRGATPDTGEIRKMMGVTKKQGAAKIDNAIKELQREFYITVVGNRRKLNKLGEPYGWAANTYDTVENWAPEVWLAGNKLTQKEAIQGIIHTGITAGPGINQRDLFRALKLKA